MKKFYNNAGILSANELMDPKVDIAFKYVFGNPQHPEITISLLNAVLDLPDDKKITKVQILNPDLNPRFKDDKFAILDIKANANDNTIIDIEMQVANRKDMIPRTLVYLARMVDEQIGRSDKYDKLQRTICINFLDFNLLENQEVHNIFNFKNQKNEKLTDLEEIHFVELKKLDKYGIINKDMLENWIKFLNNPKSEEVAMLVGEYTEFKEAKKLLSFFNLPKKIKEHYDIRNQIRQEKKSLLEGAREEGIAIGEKLGEAKGRSEGRSEGIYTQAVESAKILKSKGMDADFIQQVTGLSINEINNLK